MLPSCQVLLRLQKEEVGQITKIPEFIGNCTLDFKKGKLLEP